MKRVIKRGFLVALLSLFSSGLFGQEYVRAVGVRLGTSVGASYKEFVKPTQAIEGILDLDLFREGTMALNLTGLYKFQYRLTNDGLSWFIGPGASAALLLGDVTAFFMSLDGILGVEYKFQNAPIALSLDWNPKLILIRNAGFVPDNFALSVRFTL